MGNCKENPPSTDSDFEGIVLDGSQKKPVKGSFLSISDTHIRQSLRKDGNLTYTGDIMGEKANGQGVLTGEKYVFNGNWVNGRPNGQGKLDQR